MLPLISTHNDFKTGDCIFIENIRDIISKGVKQFKGKLIRDGKATEIDLGIDYLTDNEKEIILEGCLMNYYAKTNNGK
jgi:aconitate hydratase